MSYKKAVAISRLNSMVGVKRAAEATTSPSQSKKTHPFFGGGTTQLGTFQPSPPSLIHFTHLDPFINSPGPSKLPLPIQIVFYDLDGTLIKPKSGNTWPKNREDWAWWHESVPRRLKAEYEEGKHLIVISNQGRKGEGIKNEWKAKLALIAAKMPANVPFRVLAALERDIFRKPQSGMFDTVKALYRERGLEIDLAKSVFVGDAAGRLAGKGQFKDHGDTDFKFALNVGVKFLTPEEHFLGRPKPAYPIPPNGFRPSKIANLANLPYIVPSNTPITRTTTEIVLFVGPPAAGKTSFFRKHFAVDYEHVNQDILKSREKCLKVAEMVLSSGKSVVVDATNRNKETRAHWVQLAEKLNLPIRVFHFICPIDLARHNNTYRFCYAPPEEPKRELLPPSAFASYASMFQAPMKDEGFDEVKSVNFRFEGSEEQRVLWDRWILDS